MSLLAQDGGAPVVPKDFTFLQSPEITPEDEEAVLASLRQPHHAWGPNADALEADFAKWNGNRICFATNSGTAALHMAVAACGVGAGDEVITTAVSWTSTATCILHHNAIPVFVDVDWRTQNIDPTKIEAAITPKTKAILIVHYWGLPCDVDSIRAVAEQHKLPIIEDACQAHGSRYRGKKTGTLGNIAAFSLNQMKTLCGGEGGLLVTDDEAMAARARSLMNFGQMDHPGRLATSTHAYGMGWMYRTSDLPAAFARSQLRRLDENIRRSIENWELCLELVAGLPDAVLPVSDDVCKTNGYAFPVRVDPAAAERRGVELADLRLAVGKALIAEGIPITPARWMLPAHTVFQAKNGYNHGCPWTCHLARPDVDYALTNYPVSQRCVDSTLWLAWRNAQPLRPPNGRQAVEYVAAALKKVFAEIDRLPIVSEPPRPTPNGHDSCRT